MTQEFQLVAVRSLQLQQAVANNFYFCIKSALYHVIDYDRLIMYDSYMTHIQYVICHNA